MSLHLADDRIYTNDETLLNCQHVSVEIKFKGMFSVFFFLYNTYSNTNCNMGYHQVRISEVSQKRQTVTERKKK